MKTCVHRCCARIRINEENCVFMGMYMCRYYGISENEKKLSFHGNAYALLLQDKGKLIKECLFMETCMYRYYRIEVNGKKLSFHGIMHT